jgi:hypothetical protein
MGSRYTKSRVTLPATWDRGQISCWLLPSGSARELPPGIALHSAVQELAAHSGSDITATV